MPEDTAHTYQDVARIIETRIRSGEYPMGSKLPTQEELADEFDLGMTTIAKAIAILRTKALVVSRPPKGTFVAASAAAKRAAKKVSPPAVEPTRPPARKPGLQNPFSG